MEQLRYNIFNQVHKGLRALLYHTALQLQKTDFTNEEETARSVALLNEVIFLFEGHAHTEDSLVFPLIASAAPEMVADFEEQHVRDHELGEELESALRGLLSVSTIPARIHAGTRLQLVFREFTAFNLTHMNLEETVVNELLWKQFSDEELHEETMKIVGSIPPEKNMRYSYWMLKGLSNTEIIQWYQGMKAGAPPPVFEAMLQLAEEALEDAQFVLLRKALQLEVAVN